MARAANRAYCGTFDSGHLDALARIHGQNSSRSRLNSRNGNYAQRFALQTTALGIKHAFLNQAVEVPEVRRRLAEHLGFGERRPDLIVRFGYAAESFVAAPTPCGRARAGGKRDKLIDRLTLRLPTVDASS